MYVLEGDQQGTEASASYYSFKGGAEYSHMYICLCTQKSVKNVNIHGKLVISLTLGMGLEY